MLSPNDILLALAILMLKHFICDFILQVPFHYQNKGTYGHIGGISHAAIHGIGTFFALIYFADKPDTIDFEGPHAEITIVVLFDMIVHYHVDWAKVRINRRMHWTPTTHEEFWWLLGFDQLLHMLTYIAIIWYIKSP